MEITKEEITKMLQEAYAEGFNSAIECLKSAKEGINQTFAAEQMLAPDRLRRGRAAAIPLQSFESAEVSPAITSGANPPRW